MSAGFTPWELCFTDEDAPSPFVATAGDVVCIAEPNHEQPDEFDLRNFNLIAAAPELYAALEPFAAHVAAVRVAFDGDPVPCGDVCRSSVSFGDFERAYAAMLKARGEV